MVRKKKFQDILREKLDNKCLKFMNIKSGAICFKANKKLRDNIRDEEYVTKYINEFIASILLELKIAISTKQLDMISSITIMEDCKIYVKI